MRRLSDVSIIPAREVTFGMIPAVPVQTDGESLGLTPARVAIAEESLPLLWPVEL